MISSRLTFVLRAYRIEALLVSLACLLLIVAPFRARANVTEVVTGPTDPSTMPTPLPGAPPLGALKTLHAQAGTTLHAIDLLTQSAPDAPQVNILSAGTSPLPVAKDAALTMIGWAVDEAARAAAADVFVTVDDRAVASCPVALARPDVAKAYGVPVYASSGFTCTVPANRIPLGLHRLAIDVVTHEHAYYRVEVARQMAVR